MNSCVLSDELLLETSISTFSSSPEFNIWDLTSLSKLSRDTDRLKVGIPIVSIFSQTIEPILLS
jgi:hypothetical protein